MFKNATIFKVASTLPSLHTLESTLDQFTPCGATQERSVGWVPPRGHEHGALVESIGGDFILKLMIETKSVPAKVVKREVTAKAKVLEEQTGRKPGKKERRDLADEVRLTLLPSAFAKVSTVTVWVNPQRKLLVLDTASQGTCDIVMTELVRAIDGIAVQLVNTKATPANVMSTWLAHGENHPDFSIGRACELKATDESKAVVRYKRHNLDSAEVQAHILQGKMAVKLELTWNDRVTFTLTDAMRITGLAFLDVVFESRKEDEDSFDADVALLTGELAVLTSDLIAALGGEVAND